MQHSGSQGRSWWPVWLVMSICTALLPTLSWSKGFNEDFSATVGDFNSDGLQDIYIRQKPRIIPIALDDLQFPIPLPPDVEPFVLQQQAGGTYTIATSLTSQQRNAIAQWPNASALRLLVSDLNLDGVRDLIVKGIAASGIGSHDQLVFANTTSGKTAGGARRVDAELTSFMQDAYRWVENDAYFEAASFQNGWYTREVGRTLRAWWRVTYLQVWGYGASDGEPFLQYASQANDPDTPPYGCSSLHDCDFDYNLGEWYIWGTATEYTARFDPFHQHFNNDAVTFAKGVHASMQALQSFVAAKLQTPSIGGGERALVARESNVDAMPSDDDLFWDDLLLRAVLHDNYCGITEHCQPPAQEVSRVDILVDRRGTGSYPSQCGVNINYTHGVYQVIGYQPEVNFGGFTLERGGPDSKTPANNADMCSNKPKRIPEGTYTFSIASRTKWKNVPALETDVVIGRTDILVHAAAGAYGSIGCILVSKSTGETGRFAGGMPSSEAALAEIRKALGYTNQFKYNYGYVRIKNFPGV